MVIIEQIFKFLAPHECISCGYEGTLLCKSCALSRLSEYPQACYMCSKPSVFGRVCSSCKQQSLLRYVLVRTKYDELARKIIHQLKFNHARDASKSIATEMASLLPKKSESFLLVHIPTASSRVRLRGFDQSALIARELSGLTGIRHINLLARTNQNRQVGASVNERREQTNDIFRPLSLYLIKNTRIILVDDVLTTGSTLEAAAHVLIKSGAKSVDAVVFARA